MEEVELDVRPQALSAIARRALKRRTGARGLRSIVEQSLLGTMYELTSQKNVQRVVVDENAVTGKGSPILNYADQVEQRVADSSSGKYKKLKDQAACRWFGHDIMKIGNVTAASTFFFRRYLHLYVLL